MSGHDHRHHGHDHDHGARHGGHGHGHGGHHHAPANFGKAFAIGIVLNLAYVAGEAFYGVLAHSLALLADAGHNFGDVLGLGAAWMASILGTRRPNGRYTYGLRRSSILVALANAIVLLIVTGGIVWEGIRRLFDPEPSGGLVIVVVAAAGIAVNGMTALMFMAGRKDDLNIRAAFQHMMSDALVACGVAIAGALILWTGWLWLDPATSIVVGAIIVAGTWGLLRDSTNLALDAVPEGVDRAKVATFLKALPGVTEMHDLHIWGMSTTENALTVHLVRPGASLDDDMLHRTCAELRAHFAIHHATLQVEDGTGAHACALQPDEVV